MILRPRVVLKANSQSGSQDLLVQEARSFWDSQRDAESYGRPEATLLLTSEYLYIDLNGETAGCTATK